MDTIKEFTDAVASTLEIIPDNNLMVGASVLCEQCCDTYDTKNQDKMYELECAGFSHSACECCGSYLAGDRTEAHSFDSNGEILHWYICVDCVLYLANGDIPEYLEVE